MGERTNPFHNALAKPVVYKAFGSVIGADRTRRRFVADHVRPFPGVRILDIGCGPAEIAAHLRDADYVGVEPNPDYVKEAQRHAGQTTRVLHGGIEQLLELADPPYDRILFVGVLHHLPDDVVTRHVPLLARWLAPGGCLVAIDATICDDQSRAARRLAKMDRGEHVRSPDSYVALFQPAFSRVRTFLRSDLLRIPYTHCIIEAYAS
jgi:SAM-dependent methyltransferase